MIKIKLTEYTKLLINGYIRLDYIRVLQNIY